MKVSILDVQKKIYDGVADEVTLPVFDGEVTVMDDHEPVYFVLSRGWIRLRSSVEQMGVRTQGAGQDFQRSRRIAIHSGLARMKRNELVVLVE